MVVFKTICLNFWKEIRTLWFHRVTHNYFLKLNLLYRNQSLWSLLICLFCATILRLIILYFLFFWIIYTLVPYDLAVVYHIWIPRQLLFLLFLLVFIFITHNYLIYAFLNSLCRWLQLFNLYFLLFLSLLTFTLLWLDILSFTKVNHIKAIIDMPISFNWVLQIT